MKIRYLPNYIICRHITSIVIILFFAFNFVQAQSISSRLGGLKTQFLITTNHTVVLNDSIQHIVKRPEVKYSQSSNSSYGLSYESLHLEFKGTGEIQIWYGIKSKRHDYLLSFFDSSNKILASKYLRSNDLTKIDDRNSSLVYYSLDLLNIPLIVLDETHRINIDKVR